MKNKILVFGIVCGFLLSLSINIDGISANPGSVTVDIDLYDGYNLITIAVENDYTASSLLDNITGFNIISRWDTSLQQYVDYIEGFSGSEYDFQIVDGLGYYLLVEDDTQISFTGEELTGITIDPVEGFNLLGWYDSSSTTASYIFNSIPGCINVSIYDGVNQVYKNYRSASDPDFVISRGMGYWVEINYDFKIDFYEGYNLITIPVENDYTASNLAADIPGCEYISEWDQDEESYHSYIVGSSGPEDDFSISDGIGYYVVVTDDTSVTFNGFPLLSASVLISDGYNHLGWYDTEDTTASSVLNSIENCIKVSMYDAINQAQIDYEPGGGQGFTISRGMGYIAEVETPPQLDQLDIDVSLNVNEGDDFQVTISSTEGVVEGATVTFDGNSFLTGSDGIVTLTAPLLDSDTAYTISASKINYQSAEKTITILDEETSIQLISPNGGEVWSDTHTILWSITDKPSKPYSVTIQYKYKEGNWINIAENIIDENNLFLWDTTIVQNGYPFYVKVSLKEDNNQDGIYEKLISEDTSDNPFSIDNSNAHLGEIYGQINSSNDIISKARIFAIISVENNVITSKFTFSDENGHFSIPISSGFYNLKVSKEGYQTKTMENINVWANEKTEVNILLVPGSSSSTDSFPIFENENRDLIDAGIKNHTIGGEVTIQLDDDQIDFDNFIYIYNDVTITPKNITNKNLSFSINGDENTGGRTIVFNLGKGVFDFEKDFIIDYDGESMEMANGIEDVLNPNDDGSHPEYIIIIGSNGTQILVSIPHFSEHKISICSIDINEIAAVVMQYKEIAIISAIFIIIIASIVMFRKGKDE